jgi:hypothetical protein
MCPLGICALSNFLKRKVIEKKTWQLVHEIIKKGNSKSDSIQQIFVNNSIVSDPSLMSNYFNEYFSSVAVNIAEEIVPTKVFSKHTKKIFGSN